MATLASRRLSFVEYGSRSVGTAFRDVSDGNFSVAIATPNRVAPWQLSKAQLLEQACYHCNWASHAAEAAESGEIHLYCRVPQVARTVGQPLRAPGLRSGLEAGATSQRVASPAWRAVRDRPDTGHLSRHAAAVHGLLA